MAEANWSRHAVSVGVFEFRRTVRAVREDTARFGLTALGIVLPSLLLAAFTVLLADTIRGAGTVQLPNQVRGTFAMLWLFGVFIVGQRTAMARPRVSAESLLLTTVSARTAAVGLLVAETLRVLAYLALPVLTMAAAGVYLFGSVLILPAVTMSRYSAPRSADILDGLTAGSISLVAFPLMGLGFAATAVVLGSLLGYAVAYLVATVPFVARNKTLLGGVAALVFFGGYALLQFPQTGYAGQELLGWLPSGWFVDVGVVGTPVQGSTARAVTALVGGLAFVGVGVVLVERVTAGFWYTDPVSGDSFQTGSLRALLAPLLAVLVPWLAGAAFAMNPFGDEGAVLPVTLTAVPGRTYVHGLALPGLLLGLPLVTVLTAAAGVVSPYAPAQVAGVVALGVYLTLVTVAVTPAVGMAMPRFSAIRVGQSRAVLPPRLTAVAVHVALTVVPGSMLILLVLAPEIARAVVAGVFGFLPAILIRLAAGDSLTGVATAFESAGQSVQAVALGQFRLALGALLLLGGAVVGTALYRHAIARFDRYTMG